MMNRREALLGIGAAILTGSIGVSHADTNTTANDVDERLRHDIERFLPRENSEEGVPVLLACMNLVGKTQPSSSPTHFNAGVVAEFRRDAAAWERIRPHSPETDVGKLIELLAYRDFARGGTEPAS